MLRIYKCSLFPSLIDYVMLFKLHVIGSPAYVTQREAQGRGGGEGGKGRKEEERGREREGRGGGRGWGGEGKRGERGGKCEVGG